MAFTSGEREDRGKFERSVRSPAGRTEALTPASRASDALGVESLSSSPVGRMTSKQAFAQASSRMTAREAAGPSLQRMTAREAAHRAVGAGVSRQAEAASGLDRSALPERLKEGIEGLSGLSMDDVKVHYNSAAPAHFQALAYTRGPDIHVAPGQERHLPHEAWHVVQQRQGRVRPTAQLEEVGLNDEPALEAEADVMGARALRRAQEGQEPPSVSDHPGRGTEREAAGAAGSRSQVRTAQSARGGEPLQRKGIYAYVREQTEAAGKAEQFASVVESAVEHAVRIIAADPFLETVPGSDEGYLGAWKKTVTDYSNDPSDVPGFFFARYGYAVETIATGTLESHNINPYRFRFQVAHGHTRPDIVVVDGEDREVAWIDITSEGSAGHIEKKQGAGWQRRDYVAEVRYDRPTPADLLSTAPGMSQEDLDRIKEANTAAVQRAAYFDTGRDAIAVRLGAKLLDEYETKGSGLTMKEVSGATVSVCGQALGMPVAPSVAKGILSQLDQVEVGDDVNSGQSWANWAFKDVRTNSQQAKEYLIAYGKTLAT
ncbi:eCIS core domain-containing protein [Sorangium sp. So ce1389]|uniref:eCIS core domain-containing protein n=1 Tax=Sorangium sp. So ce1389 TaxID=3133336 RepID=UPI003F5D92CB